MRHLAFVDKSSYTTALLIKEVAFNPKELKDNYDIDWDDTICFSLTYENNKAPVKLAKESLSSIIKACKHLQVKTLLVADSIYFKVLTKLPKAEPYYGSVCRCVLADMDVILIPNYQALFYNPSIKSKIDLALDTLKNHLQGTHVELGTGIIHHEEYPDTLETIQECLQKLHNHSVLACDTETTSLNVMCAKLVSISFAWSQHEGIAFLITDEIKPILKQFFIDYKGQMIYHNATYDVSILIAQLFMRDIQ